jgi:hypothetical protein
VLSPLLNSLFNHNFVAKHDSNTIIKFDDTTVVGLITYNDETAYKEEVRDLAVWCQDNNLSLNVNKTKELLVDYRTRRAEQAPTNIDGTDVEWGGSRVSSSLVSTSTTNYHVPNTQDSHEDGKTKPIPPQKTEKIWHGSPDPQKSNTVAPSRAS